MLASRRLNNNFDEINNNNDVAKASSSRKRNHEDVDWDIVIQGMTTDAMVISQCHDWMKANENTEPEREMTTYNKKRYRIDSDSKAPNDAQYNHDEGKMNM